MMQKKSLRKGYEEVSFFVSMTKELLHQTEHVTLTGKPV